ncbi:diaminopimelate epimerase [Methylibium sp.]|uniref:diaminopimelate epimerase n=1 Tax=Methylibium sp. TaxID=2067992 RepID=UPI00286A3F5F|nr:diaminopimelate epimerase [Methylibium sp.]
MKLRFTKMQGAGNDFVVLDATRAPLALSAAQVRRLADRRLGVGADQVLIVGPSAEPGIDFSYRIFNADGGEVEQCGNGARCFVRYVREAGLTTKDRIRVRTAGGVIEPRWLGEGRVTVDMGSPVFEPARVPFDATGLVPREIAGMPFWPLDVAGVRVEVAVLSMGNPHAVQRVDDLARAEVERVGPALESHPRFAQRVNAGFMQLVSKRHIALRVHERGVGETLACGTGACAAVVVGVRAGWLDGGVLVRVDAPGGRLDVQWSGVAGDSVLMTGPAERVFDGEIDLPD